MMPGNRPLCVDFDGTLTPVNTTDEALLALIKTAPRNLLQLLAGSRAGAAASGALANAGRLLDAASLPRRHELIDWLRQQRRDGRRLVLLVDGDAGTAQRFAEPLQLFDAILTTVPAGGTPAQRKLQTLRAEFCADGFDFVTSAQGGSCPWGAPGQVVLSSRSAAGADASAVGADAAGPDQELEAPSELIGTRPSWRVWITAIRLHQWVKNVLIFVPALLAHSLFTRQVIESGLLAFLAFGLCASSVYVLNDLFDLSADRLHPRKRHRPFAAGELSVRAGLAASALLLTGSAILALSVNASFAGLLGAYYLMTLLYTMRLKRVELLDVMMLAALYTTRIIAGATATGVVASFWLLAFSVFMFLSLGFVKRYAELEGVAGNARGGSGRGYQASDLPLILSLGTAAGYCAIVVMALYINSPDSQALYHHHKPLWLICPLMLLWISRVWTLTARGHMHDDPLVFALRDRPSLLIFALLALIIVTAS
jgi:4-hydroxybenzoate polyprenyltransferase